MGAITPEQAEAWLRDGPPVVFAAECTVEEAQAWASEPELAPWRFTRHTKALARMTVPQLRERIKADFLNEQRPAPTQAKQIMRQAWEETESKAAIVKLVGALDYIRDNWSSLNAESKAWLRDWADYRGIKRRGEA